MAEETNKGRHCYRRKLRHRGGLQKLFQTPLQTEVLCLHRNQGVCRQCVNRQHPPAIRNIFRVIPSIPRFFLLRKRYRAQKGFSGNYPRPGSYNLTTMYREGYRVLLTLLQFFATKFLFLALHLESGCFPRPLTAGKKPPLSAPCAPGCRRPGKADPSQSAAGGAYRKKNTTPCPAIRTTLFPSAPSA